jgi:hypothetical protein
MPKPSLRISNSKTLTPRDFRRGYKGTESRTVCKPLFQQRTKLNPLGMPQQKAPHKFTLVRGPQTRRFSTQQTGAGHTLISQQKRMGLKTLMNCSHSSGIEGP